ncbi:MAG: thiamine phosphate synthase [Nitrospinaceae bacterium]
MITDRSRFTTEKEFLQALEAALEGGVRAVQLREKDLTPAALLALARLVKVRTAKRGVKLFINDRVDIAEMAGADGVQLTETSAPVREVRNRFPHLLIGTSVHSLDRARQAEAEGADFITFSPVFATPSKKNYGPPQGIERLREVCGAVRLPVLALGGINKKRVSTVRDQGAFGVALISGIWDSHDIKLETLKYMKCFGRR